MTRKLTDKGWEVTPDAPRPQQGVYSPVAAFDFVAECQRRNIVAVPVDEYRAMTERIEELERTIDDVAKHAAEAGGPPPLPQATTGKIGKKGKLSVEEIKAGIESAQSLDDLTELMSRVDDPALLALADAKAGELK